MLIPEIIRRTGVRWGFVIATILALGTALMFGVVYWFGTHALFRAVDKTVIEQLELLSARPPGLLPFMITSRAYDRSKNPHVITLVGLFGSDRQWIAGDIHALPSGLKLNGRVQMITDQASTGETLYSRAIGHPLPDGRILVVARNVDDLLEMRSGVLWALGFALGPAILLSIAGGVMVGARTQRRLAEQRRTAEQIIAGHLEKRLVTRTPGDELDQLSMLVNRILDRLEEHVHALKAAGEDIAHDLRTPLAAVRIRLERGLAQSESREQLLAIMEQAILGIDQALASVTALLRIAEIEHGRQRSGFASVDLAEVVRDAVEAYESVAEEKKIALSPGARGPVVLRCDRDLMLELVLNLVDNAVKYAPEGGDVQVALEGTTEHPVLRVADNGPGIPENERDLVFRRFYRSDASRSSKGTGLGLSLVAAIAKLHGFTLSLHNNRPGCIVELQFWTSAEAPEQRVVSSA